MIANLIRKALAPSIETLLQEERETINDIIYGMENALDEMNLIRGSDIADTIANSIDTYSLARTIAGEIEVDTTGIVDDVVSQIETTLEIQYQNMITVNMNNRLNEIEKKMNILLEHFGITPENV